MASLPQEVVQAKERQVSRLFKLSLLLKGAVALLQLVGGVALYLVALVEAGLTHLVSRQALLNFISALAHEELTEDPRDYLVTHLIGVAQNLTAASLHFAAFYLLVHGVVKLWFIVGLFRKKLWYYPTAIVVFGLFMVYQVYRFSITHSVLLMLITVVDAVVVWLTWHEYNYLRGRLRIDSSAPVR